MKRPTQKAVAQRAGVSVTTMSRYLNGALDVKPETEARIRAAMRALGFQASPSTTDFAERRPVIGLLVPNSGAGYFGALMDAVVRHASEHDFDVITGSVLESATRQARYMEMMRDWGVSGILTTRHNMTDEALRQALDAGLPVVVIDDSYTGPEPVDYVTADNYSGGYQATAHLVQKGHRRIAFIGGLADLSATVERRRGWRDALLRAGIDPEDQVVMTGEFSESFGQAVVPHLLEQTTPPSAVFAASDLIALGILTAARRHDLRVPEDLSIIGFDDMPAASLVSPRLTTLHTPLSDMARQAVRCLTRRMTDPGAAPRAIVTPVALTEGESVAMVSEDRFQTA